ncbi:MAG TPA: HD-GYP domain-containing protein [Vicinamibacterales bacterium]|nr:HD-GYP domain-containing protein [Vicinamibacterales bacterium]
MAAAPRTQLSEELLRRLAASLRAGQLYSRGHPLIGRNLEGLGRAVDALHDLVPSVVIGIVGDEVIVDDLPVGGTGGLAALVRRLRQIGIERIVIERGVQAEEIAALADFVATAAPDAASADAFPALAHVRVGRVTLGERVEGGTADMAEFRRLYADAVQSAELLWDSTRAEQRPDATVARTTVDGLAQAVSQNRTALMALTALREYDNYTFTHMVNVSILTMAQARALGVDGPLLREFGLAALMHDIGKVKTPLEILTKADALTPGEFAIMKRHTIEGAEILRATPDVPALAPVVAFEHHLRLDGSGYPDVTRASLNLGTMLCSIADVYDAMRSQRSYQRSFPTDRILEVMRRNDGQQFDQHLVRRFAQLVGVYPAGNLVRLNTDEIAVVMNPHAPDPYRPHVRIVLDRHGTRVMQPLDVNLWELAAEGALAPAIVGPVDPADVGIDPLTLL